MVVLFLIDRNFKTAQLLKCVPRKDYVGTFSRPLKIMTDCQKSKDLHADACFAISRRVAPSHPSFIYFFLTQTQGISGLNRLLGIYSQKHIFRNTNPFLVVLY